MKKIILFLIYTLFIFVSVISCSKDTTPTEPTIINNYYTNENYLTNIFYVTNNNPNKIVFLVEADYDLCRIYLPVISEEIPTVYIESNEIIPNISESGISWEYSFSKSFGDKILYSINYKNELFTTNIILPNKINNVTINDMLLTNSQGTNNLIVTNIFDIKINSSSVYFKIKFETISNIYYYTVDSTNLIITNNDNYFSTTTYISFILYPDITYLNYYKQPRYTNNNFCIYENVKNDNFNVSLSF